MGGENKRGVEPLFCGWCRNAIEILEGDIQISEIKAGATFVELQVADIEH